MLHGAQTLERGDLPVLRRADGDAARPDRFPVHDDGAGATLGKSAAKPGAVEFQVVSQDVEQRRGGIGFDGVRFAIHVQ